MARRPRKAVTGHGEAAKTMRELNKVLVPAARSATKASFEPTLAAAKQNLRDDGSVLTGALLRSMVVRLIKRSPKLSPRYVVTPDPKSKVRHAHLVEFGRAPNADGKGGYAGTRFLTRAFKSTVGQVPVIWGRKFGEAFERHAKRVAAKVKR